MIFTVFLIEQYKALSNCEVNSFVLALPLPIKCDCSHILVLAQDCIGEKNHHTHIAGGKLWNSEPNNSLLITFSIRNILTISKYTSG